MGGGLLRQKKKILRVEHIVQGGICVENWTFVSGLRESKKSHDGTTAVRMLTSSLQFGVKCNVPSGIAYISSCQACPYIAESNN